MAILTLGENHFKLASRAFFFTYILEAIWKVLSSNFMLWVCVCVMFINSVEFKPIEWDVNARVNHHLKFEWMMMCEID
jgi:hypothetical protein